VEDIERLFGNIQEIVQFQKQFLHSLEQAVEQEAPATADANDAARFKVCDFISNLFLVAGLCWHRPIALVVGSLQETKSLSLSLLVVK